MKTRLFISEKNFPLRALSDIPSEGIMVTRILAALLATAAFGQTADPAYTQLDRGYQELRARNYDAAIADFEGVLAVIPDRPSIHKDLAYTLLKVGENTRARDHFAEAMRLDPTDHQVAMEYGFLCYETGEPVTARRIFDRLRASEATAAEAFENIDRPLREGIARWQQAVAANPGDYSGHEELARLAEQRDETALAAEHFEKAWRLRPERRELLLDLGRTWKALGRTEDANAALLAASRGAEPRVAEEARELLPARYPYVYEFEKALELDPTNGELRRELAFLHVAMGRNAEAEEQLKLLRSKEGDSDSLAPSLRTAPSGNDPAEAKEMGVKSLEKGYMKDALRYLTVAHENDPVDFDVILKLGWTNNMLKKDREAVKWFDLARRSPDTQVASEGAKAYRNLEADIERFRTTVWVFPTFSTRWHDLFAYAQAKTEIRFPRARWLHPYASVRFVGDTHSAERFVSGWAPEYLSEQSVILGGGVATQPWHGANGWFEAGEALQFLPVLSRNSAASPDYRGGVSFTRAARLRHWFAETNDDLIYVHRFDNDTLMYSQNRFGHDLPAESVRAQVYWNWNATFDVKREYWANFVETGPGFRFHPRWAPPSVLISVNALRGIYLITNGNPHPAVFNDFRVGVWYAFTR
jgi:Tfp pilus assembly protein PilF